MFFKHSNCWTRNSSFKLKTPSDCVCRHQFFFFSFIFLFCGSFLTGLVHMLIIVCFCVTVLFFFFLFFSSSFFFFFSTFSFFNNSCFASYSGYMKDLQIGRCKNWVTTCVQKFVWKVTVWNYFLVKYVYNFIIIFFTCSWWITIINIVPNIF